MPTRFRLLLPACLAALSLLAGLSHPVGATSTLGQLLTVSGPSPYGACSTNHADFVSPNAEVEPQLAVQPAALGSSHPNLIGVWQQDRWQNGGAQGIAAAYSSDGGVSWTETTLPFSRCAPSGLPFDVASDPWISYGPDGVAYASALVGDPFKKPYTWGIAAATSADGGRTWTHAKVVESSTGAHLADKDAVTADPTRPGHAYVVWDSDESRNNKASAPGWFSRTVNGGKTWSKPRVIVPAKLGEVTIGHQILVNPRNGRLYDIFARGRQNPPTRQVCVIREARKVCHRVETAQPFTYAVVVIASRDGGTTWSKPTTVAADRSVGIPAAVRWVRSAENLPSAAINPTTGKLYAVWQDSRFSDGVYDEIALSSSSDGTHWTAPRRVSTHTGWPAFTPTIAVDPAGVVGVTYYDIREFAFGLSTLPTDYWFISSSDGGATFAGETRLAGPFDMLSAPNARGYFVGDYQALIAAGGSFRALFVQANSGDTANPTDVFTETVQS